MQENLAMHIEYKILKWYDREHLNTKIQVEDLNSFLNHFFTLECLWVPIYLLGYDILFAEKRM